MAEDITAKLLQQIQAYLKLLKVGRALGVMQAQSGIVVTRSLFVKCK